MLENASPITNVNDVRDHITLFYMRILLRILLQHPLMTALQTLSHHILPSHTAMNAGLKLSLLLGSSSEARALLDSASSAFFISDHLARMLNLPHSNRNTYITSIAGLSHKSPTQSITNFVVSPSRSPSPRIQVSAIIVPQVTCDLPLHSVPFDLKWDHLSDLQLADPDFGGPGRIDVLLGIAIFTNVLAGGLDHLVLILLSRPVSDGCLLVILT